MHTNLKNIYVDLWNCDKLFLFVFLVRGKFIICSVVVTIDLFTCIKYVWQNLLHTPQKMKILCIYNFLNEWIKHWEKMGNGSQQQNNRKKTFSFVEIFAFNFISFTVAVCFLLHKVGTNFYHFSFRVLCFCCTFWGAKTKGKKNNKLTSIKSRLSLWGFCFCLLYPFCLLFENGFWKWK